MYPISKNNSIDVYLKLRFFSALFFSAIITVNLVYHVMVVGLNPLQLVLVGTLLESVCFIFEIPTGIVADLYSRKLSVIIGVFLVGLGFIFEGVFATFLGVLIAQIIWGIGYTFISGAREAWIADELGEHKAGKAFVRGQKMNQIGMFFGIIIAIFLANIDIRLPIILGGALYALQAIYLCKFMSENNFKPVPMEKRETFKNVKKTFLNGLNLVKNNKIILSLIGIVMVFGMFSEGFDRLWTPFLINDFVFPSFLNFEPVVWFGIISLIATSLTTLTIEFIDRKIDMNNQKEVIKSLFFINMFLMLMVFVFALAFNFIIAVFAYCLIFILKESFVPLSNALINQSLESKTRATVFSFSSQMDSFGQIVFGPFLGLIASVISIKIGILASGLIIILSLFFYFYLLNLKK
ncbi:MAG TPA: MFS transporter [Candidatus Pacearchaeota archaeon]|nr:MFS transporter [Candidatus Pacearchaeota archaeon]